MCTETKNTGNKRCRKNIMVKVQLWIHLIRTQLIFFCVVACVNEKHLIRRHRCVACVIPEKYYQIQNILTSSNIVLLYVMQTKWLYTIAYCTYIFTYRNCTGMIAHSYVYNMLHNLIQYCTHCEHYLDLNTQNYLLKMYNLAFCSVTNMNPHT